MTFDGYPSDWTQKPILDVADFFRGVSWRKSEAGNKDRGMPVISIPNITQNRQIDWNCKHFIDKKIKDEQLLRRGDVIFVGSSGSLQNVGRNAQVRKVPKSATFASFTFLGRPKAGIDERFFYYLVNSPCVAFEKYTSRAADGKYNFQLTQFRGRTVVTLPSPAEQKNIAHIVGVVQSAIENQEKIIRKTAELKRALMQKLFSEGLHGEKQKQTEIGLMPQSWNVRPLSELREFLQYGTSVKCGYHDKGCPVIRIPNVADGKISCDDLKWCELSEKVINSLNLELGDILFIRTNGVRERVGSCAVYQGQPHKALFASYLIRARPKRNELVPEFFYYFSRTSTGLSQLAGRSSSSSDGKFNINTKIIDSILVPTPVSLNEQQEIVNALQALDRKIDVHGHKEAVLQAMFGALLNQLMTGQIRVKDLDLKIKEAVAVS